jgi:ubiquinone/menaquinone biosynthesis C-methylase UbiE
MTSNRLSNEKAHGAYLAAHGAGDIWNWSSPAGQARWRRRCELLKSGVTAADRVLEIGCGTGVLSTELARIGSQVVAVDVSADLLQQASRSMRDVNLAFLQADACKMPFLDETFDVVVGSSVLHHLEIEDALNEFHRVLKPGGRIVFAEPNMVNPQIFLQKNIPWLKARLGDSPDETAFVRWSLNRLLKKAGFVQRHLEPFDFLHPATPELLVPLMRGLGACVERIPLLREVAGSLFIRAVKGSA